MREERLEARLAALPILQYEFIDTAEMTVMIREYPTDNAEGQTRFSVKTMTPGLSARAIAQQFGGGGHFNASGGFMHEEPEKARALLEKCCKACFEHL